MTGEIDRGDGRDKILPAADQSTAIRPPEVLGAEADEVRSLGVEAAHDLNGVVHVRGVDKGGDAMSPPDGSYVPQWDSAIVTIEVSGQVERDGVRADRLLDLFAPGACFRANLDGARSRQQRTAVVLVAMPPLQDNLIRHAGGLGQPLHLLPVVAGETGANAERDGGRSAGRNPRRLYPEHSSDSLSRAIEKLDQIDEAVVGLRHCRPDGRGQAGAAEVS